jgi:hypothetical protein
MNSICQIQLVGGNMCETVKDNRLKQYVICSHFDKPLTGGRPRSVYECMIQAGAALTDKRICELNDHDGFPESISDRNTRYCEVTAMWWVGKHMETPYIGISHYRRRLELTDEEIRDYLDQNIDIITSVPMRMNWSVEENYRVTLWGTDWDLLLEIMQKYAPEDVAFAETCFSENIIHLCNMNIMKSELYREFCDWAFPMLDELYRRSPEKTDVYQHRDVGFIAERLSHLFVMKKIAEGLHVAEARILDLQSSDWDPEAECDTGNFAEVWAACDRLYRQKQITRCQKVLNAVLNKGLKEEKLQRLSDILIIGILERRELPQSLHEYLPRELREDLDTLLEAYEGFRQAVLLWRERDDEETRKLLAEYRTLTHFSNVAARQICQGNAG